MLAKFCSRFWTAERNRAAFPEAEGVDGRHQEPQLHGGCRCTRHRTDAAGRRVLSCLPLAATLEGREVTTIEGLVEGDQLHPVQVAFIKYDSSSAGTARLGKLALRSGPRGAYAKTPLTRIHLST
jgi:hypothetical protein